MLCDLQSFSSQASQTCARQFDQPLPVPMLVTSGAREASSPARAWQAANASRDGGNAGMDRKQARTVAECQSQIIQRVEVLIT